MEINEDIKAADVDELQEGTTVADHARSRVPPMGSKRITVN